jgi:hypothetical protein
MKVAELEGELLDYWVAKIEYADGFDTTLKDWIGRSVPFSRDWKWGGPIIEREKIGITYGAAGDVWHAMALAEGVLSIKWHLTGPTPPIAAMRAYVASKLGPEVPDTPPA